jgi:predicted RNA binding protein YcfA (HicA-like mRNA interferase family)
MPRLPRITAAELLRALRRDGWEELRRRGSHAVLVHPTKPGIVVVPIHAGKTLKPGTLASILEDAGLTVDELRRLL